MATSTGRGKINGAGPGRPKGSKDKFTSLKESFLETYQEIGGTEALTEWASKDENEASFTR